jgi:hypothetical protein
MNVRSDKKNERHSAVAFPDVRTFAAESRNVALRRVTIVVVTIFWLGQFGANTLFTQISSPELAISSLLPRALICAAGELITLICIALQDRWRDSRLRTRTYWAIAFTILSAGILGALNHFIYEAFLIPMGTSGFWTVYPTELIPKLWVYGSLYAMALAIAYSADVSEREEEIAGLRTLAQEAQLRALRSQLNPHFLFNALNSIASLIRDGRPAQAEETTEQLADFLRMTLSLDPQRMISLDEEVSLQVIYLDIQKLRFPTRLNVVFDIAPDVEDALIPNLLLQPLVENSIKYAVARSTARVTVRISAKADGGKLQLIVEDDGGNASGPGRTRGSGMGLANVADRLTAHFGEQASLSSAPRSEGGFCNAIRVPLYRAS